MRTKSINISVSSGDYVGRNKILPFRVNRLYIRRTFQDLWFATQMISYENILLALEKRKFAYPGKERLRRVDEILEAIHIEVHNIRRNHHEL